MRYVQLNSTESTIDLFTADEVPFIFVVDNRYILVSVENDMYDDFLMYLEDYDISTYKEIDLESAF